VARACEAQHAKQPFQFGDDEVRLLVRGLRIQRPNQACGDIVGVGHRAAVRPKRVPAGGERAGS
jgi:hypothetical protein